MIDEQSIDLACHPSTRTDAVRSIQVLVRLSANAELEMTFRLDGDIARVMLPSPRASRIGTELWRHTCFEAFVAIDGRAAYHEFNFAPSGEWAVLSFSAYRNGGPLEDEKMRPQISVHATERRLELDALVRLETLSALHRRSALRVGLCAVVEARDGFSYWAIRHPGDKPDFHNGDGFSLMLSPRDSE